MDVLTKGEFAAHINVSAGRVSQMIAQGLIGPDALRGEGRSARIHVATALEQIRARRHVGQSLGNGIGTTLDGSASATASTQPDTGPADPARLIQLERLETERRRNRLAKVEEARVLGQLVDGAAVEREAGRVAQQVVSAFVGMQPDIANAIAAKFNLPQRDVLHLIRQVTNDKRAGLAQAHRQAAEALPETLEVVIQ